MPKRKKIEPIRYNRAIIRPTQQGTFRAEINHRYFKHRKTLPTVNQAKAWLDAKLIEVENNERPLADISIRDAQQAVGILPHGVTLLEAAQHYRRTHQSADITLDAGVKAFLAEKASAGLRQRSLYQLRSSMNRIAADYGTHSVSDIGGQALIDWLDAHGYKGATRDGYRRAFRNFFGWCVRVGYATSNPACAITVPKTDQGLPQVFHVPQVKAVMSAASKHVPELCPYLALGFFAGIRPGELMRLDWPAVSDHIHIGPAVAKTRSQRFVGIAPNLRKWLAAFPGSGPVCPVRESARDRRLLKAREAAKVDHWPHDVMRHSFATYHLARYANAPKTAHELGHSSPDMLYRHYRNLATVAEGRAYFSINPGADSSNDSSNAGQKP